MTSRMEAAFRSSTLHVGTDARVDGEAGHDDAPQGLVGVAVAATVETVACELARGGLDGGEATEIGPRWLPSGGFHRLLQRPSTTPVPWPDTSDLDTPSGPADLVSHPA